MGGANSTSLALPHFLLYGVGCHSDLSLTANVPGFLFVINLKLACYNTSSFKEGNH